MNELPCGQCENYDPSLGPGEKHIGSGWCIPRSKYAAHEGPGQVFPPGVTRVAAGELAVPYIVEADQVIGPCEMARGPIDYDPAERKREMQTFKDKDGVRVLR
jgi:hypothetical protein